jgi:hypothetical protein
MRAFRDELAALYEKYGMRVTSCGCCGEWIAEAGEFPRSAAMKLEGMSYARDVYHAPIKILDAAPEEANK